VLLENKISFAVPDECESFAGSEALLSNSREAKLNLLNLVEKLRPFWQRDDFSKSFIQKDEFDIEDENTNEIEVTLYDNNGNKLENIRLKVDEEKLLKILKNRINKGIEAFFILLENVFDTKDEINIFLAGNSSKSPIVKELFEKRIKNKNIKLFAPLDNKNIEKPNGKTGVAFGLIETRKNGGNILVIPKKLHFKYYLGRNKRKQFYLIIDKNTPYNQWVEFLDASEEFFDIYYTSCALALTNLPITDKDVKKLSLKIDEVDENKNIYIRLISPSEFEYGVGENENNISHIKKVRLKEY
jgi:hypothetical protein